MTLSVHVQPMARRTEIVLVALSLLLAGVLRLGWPEITEFKRDEAALYSLALDVAEFKALPLRGIGSSVGLPNTAISVYVFAIPLFFWKSPLAATLWVGVLNTAAVALTYFFARRYFGGRAAVLAVLLYAAAPWAVIYSRKIWAQNVLPLFVVAYIYTAALTFIEARRRWLPAHLLLLALIAQIHYSGLLFLPITGALTLIFRRNLDWRTLGWGTVLAALTGVPFGLYVLQNSGGSGLGGLLNRPFQFSFASVQLAALVSMGTEIHSLAGSQEFRNYLAAVPDFTFLLWFGGALILFGLWLAFRQSHTSPVTRHTSRLLVAWLLLPPLAFLIHSTPVFPHYFILILPAPFLLAALALDALMTRFKTQWVRAAGWAIACVIAGAQVWLFAALIHFIGTRATPGAFGTPLGQLLQVAGAVRGAPDVVIVSAGAHPHLDEVPAVFDVLLRGTPHRFVDGRTTAVFPAGEARVVLWPMNDSPATAAYAQLGDLQVQATIPLRQNEGQVQVLAANNAAQHALTQLPHPREASALLSNLAEILGSGSDGRAWQLWWRAPEGSEDVTIFAHLLDASGQRVAQADVPTYPAVGWRTGDVVISFFELNNVGYIVRSGMYQSTPLTPIEILDVNGNPAGQWLEFPLNNQ
ncbi:MAG: glycosyltransferase family 39 protein [Anaerolineales bacterium]|nr:glycosyltransferase family 39 protein [Anaerolineales bacterium]